MVSFDKYSSDILFLSMENFKTWLEGQLRERGWKPADLAKESGLSSAVISNILNGHRKVGEKTASAIAHGLKLPPDLVFEKAGLLPPKPELSPIKRALLHLAEGLPDSDIATAIAMLEAREDFYKKNPSARPNK